MAPAMLRAMETYIVRMWAPGANLAPSPAVELTRGFVRHVRSGHEQSFTSWAELQAVLMGTRFEQRAKTTEAGEADLAGGPQ